MKHSGVPHLQWLGMQSIQWTHFPVSPWGHASQHQLCKREAADLADEAVGDRGMAADAVQEKEQALISISENARRHIERSRADRARTYDTLLGQYRQGSIQSHFLLHHNLCMHDQGILKC